MAQRKQLQIPADENRLGEVRDFVTRVCTHFGLPERAVANVRLAVDEACTNVIKHAYAGREGEIDLVILKHRRWLEVRIRDQGERFDGVVQQPDLDRYIETRRKGGLGVYLMYRVVDKVRYESTADGNVWVLKKRLPRGSSFSTTLRLRYSLRSAMILGLLTALACVPLWIGEGRRQRSAAEQELRSLAFSVVENARPVLRQHIELSPEQTRLFEALHALKRRDPRLLSVTVVDHDGIIWAADRTAATFNRFAEPAHLGKSDSHGIRTTLQTIEGEPVVHLAALVQTEADGGRKLGSVHLSMRWGEVEAAVQAARLRIIVGALVFYALATAILAGLIGTVLLPVQRLVEGLRLMHQDGEGLRVDGPREIGAIAAAFNELNSRMRSARENAEEHENLQKDLTLAREIQQTLLPQSPPYISGFDLARLYQPAQDIGGDYYDFLKVNEEMTGIVVADVSGKGVPGSLVMSMLRTALHMEARNNTNAGDVLARMNAFLSADMRKGMFVTMFYVILDSKNRVVSYASAGHNPMILYRMASKETFFLKPRGFPVGLKLPDDASFGRSLDVERLRLQQGDMLVLYTDGITEALNEQREQFGEERLLEAIKRFGERSATECVAAIEEELIRFAGDAAQSDDITLVAIKESSLPGDPLGGVRQKLVDLVEEKGLSVEEACQQIKVSPSTYYRFKKRVEETALSNGPAEEGAPSGPLTPDRAPAPQLLRPEGPAAEGLSHEPVLARQEIPPAALCIEESNLRGSVAAIDRIEGGAIVQLEGFIDSSSCAALENLLAAAGELWNAIVVDLQDVAFLSSRAWGVMAAYVTELHRKDGTLVLAGMRREVSEVYRMLGFESVLRAFDQSEAACAALRVAAISTGSPNDEERRLQPDGRGGSGRPSESDQDDLHEEGAAELSLLKQPVSSTTRSLSRATVAPESTLATHEDIDAEWESLRVRSGCVGPAGEVTLLTLEGVLDTVSAQRFQNIIEKMIQNGATRILVDLSCTEFVSSAGWGIFSGYLRELRAVGGDLKLFGMNRELARIYQLLNLDDILASFDLMVEALEDFGLHASAAAESRDESCAQNKEAPLAEGCMRPEVLAPGGRSDGRTAVDTSVAIEALERQSDPNGELESAGQANFVLEPFGSTGSACRLVLNQHLGLQEAKRLSHWAHEGDPELQLLLVDARHVQACDAETWYILAAGLSHMQNLGTQVHLLRPERRCLLPREQPFPIHDTLPEALAAFQNHSTASLSHVRLAEDEFNKDAELRGEGWHTYLELLRQACREEEEA